ncbi:prolipoprotein diacylglyceryl transferase [Chloroflexota bacterium]
MIEIDVNPVVFLTIRWYGIMVALGILAMVLWVAWQVKKGANLTYDTVFMAALVGIPSGVVVSRLLHVVDRWDYFSQNMGQIIGGSGLTIWGAILGATLGIWVYSKISKFRFGYLADIMAPGLILAQVIGRVGCILNGCCYGDTCDLPWAIIYSHPDSLGPLGVPVHPTQAYEIFYLLVVLVIILLLRHRLKPAGSLFILYLGFYSLWRLMVDFIRDGSPFLRNLGLEGNFFLLDMHQAQVIGIIGLLVIIPALAIKTRWIKAGESYDSLLETPPAVTEDENNKEIIEEPPAAEPESEDNNE